MIHFLRTGPRLHDRQSRFCLVLLWISPPPLFFVHCYETGFFSGVPDTHFFALGSMHRFRVDAYHWIAILDI